ncbi:MAG: hypothetical protein DMG90_00825 [Acidobacteria bacterium]|nr:MAG: hypothetical protein DMG90_00825 [Acidobacteriota bacterium]
MIGTPSEQENGTFHLGNGAPEARSNDAIPTYWQELREVLTKPAHPNSPVQNPEFPSFHEGHIQSPF